MGLRPNSGSDSTGKKGDLHPEWSALAPVFALHGPVPQHRDTKTAHAQQCSQMWTDPSGAGHLCAKCVRVRSHFWGLGTSRYLYLLKIKNPDALLSLNKLRTPPQKTVDTLPLKEKYINDAPWQSALIRGGSPWTQLFIGHRFSSGFMASDTPRKLVAERLLGNALRGCQLSRHASCIIL